MGGRRSGRFPPTRTVYPHHKELYSNARRFGPHENGATVYQCAACGEPHVTHRSCGNRHCPGCQQHRSYQWLARQLERQLPTHYFMLTFTVPEPLRAFLRSHQRIGYGALFEASSGAIKALAQDRLGADTPGFFEVLHTWGRQLSYHPHIHYVVPGGALSSADSRWHAVQHRVLSAGACALANLSGKVPRCDGCSGRAR